MYSPKTRRLFNASYMATPYERITRIVRNYADVGNTVKVEFLTDASPPKAVGYKALGAFMNGRWVTVRESTYKVTVGCNWPGIYPILEGSPATKNTIFPQSPLATNTIIPCRAIKV